MTDQTPTPAPEWVDGDPQMEAVAAAVWEHCERRGPSLVVDDPRNIAAAAVAAVRAAPDPGLREALAAAIRKQAETGNVRYDAIAAAVLPVVAEHVARELERITADNAQLARERNHAEATIARLREYIGGPDVTALRTDLRKLYAAIAADLRKRLGTPTEVPDA